ncbi:OmpA family protein [Clostridiaceae bacterium Marseille-Q4143]|nr:OmpA family protein [Clostridiaceae bacterium Marseille-Q4143]
MVSIGEDKCLFLPDSAEFVNIEEVKATLKSIIELVNQDSSISLGFCGTTAKAGTAEGCRKLSMEWASAVERLMCQMGLNKERVGSVMGLGYENPYYLNDQNADGSLNEKITCNNRAVIIYKMNSPITEKLKKFNKE